jgi:hypothetical protein
MEFKRDASAKQLLLKKIRYYITCAVDSRAFPNEDDLAIESFYAVAEKRLYTNIRMFLWGKKISGSIREWVIVPSSLWNHLKLSVSRRLPSFLGKRIKVDYKQYPKVINHYNMCPHLGIDGKDESHLHFLRNEEGKKYEEDD